MQICAPVSVRVVPGRPSTSTASWFSCVDKVKRGFAGRGSNAASPPGAALLSFPGKSGQRGAAMNSGEAEGTGNDGRAEKVNGWSCGLVQERLGAVSCYERETAGVDCRRGECQKMSEGRKVGDTGSDGKYVQRRGNENIWAYRPGFSTGPDPDSGAMLLYFCKAEEQN